MPTPKYKIGSDPEFNVLLGGVRVPANKAWEQLFLDYKDFSGCTLKTNGGVLGCDGCPATAELRPLPALDPREVTENIGKCLSPLRNKNSFFDYSTLSIWAPVGGHVHLEIATSKTERWIKDAHKKLLSFYLPIMLGEQQTNLKLRMKSYGDITDVKIREGKPTLELRVPSAEWLTSRKVTEATLAYLSVIWHEINEHPQNLDKTILLKTIEQEKALQELAVSRFETLTKGLLKQISKNVRTFELYPEYKKEIEFILTPEKVLAEKKKHNFLINSGWSLGTRKVKPSKQNFLKLTTSLTGNNIAIRQEELPLLGVGLNPGDHKIEEIGKALSQALSQGHRLARRYYFFGLRKGVGDFLISIHDEDELIRTLEAPSVKNSEESDLIHIVSGKMLSKAKSAFRSRDQYTINFKTNKVERDSREIIAFGIPYAYRDNLSEGLPIIMEKLWDLDHGPLVPHQVEIDPKNTESLPEELRDPDPLTEDQNSQASELGRGAIRSTLREQDLESVDDGEEIPLDELPDDEGYDDDSYESYEDDDERDYDKSNSPNQQNLCAE